jgi:hypothetical protein
MDIKQDINFIKIHLCCLLLSKAVQKFFSLYKQLQHKQKKKIFFLKISKISHKSKWSQEMEFKDGVQGWSQTMESKKTLPERINQIKNKNKKNKIKKIK